MKARVLLDLALLATAGATFCCILVAEGKTMELKVTSTAFTEGAMIPKLYTCDGKDISPPLQWSGTPPQAKTIALIADDPDTPVNTWVHWVLFNLPATSKGLPEHVPTDKTLPSGAKQGITDFKRVGYGGPCPPGGTHRYYFKLYALDSELKVDAGASKAEVLQAMEGHVLAQGQLMGRYKR